MAARQIKRRDEQGSRGAGEASRPGAAARVGGAISCPALIMLALLGGAVAVPLLDRPDPTVRRLDLLPDAFVTGIAFGVEGDRIFATRQAFGPSVVLLDDDGLRRGQGSEPLISVAQAMDPVGGALIIATGEGEIRVLDPESLAPRLTMPGHRGRVQGLAVSGDGTRLVSADNDGGVRLWDLADGRLDREFRVPIGPTTCTLSPDGTTIALGGRDGDILAIDAADGRVIARRDGHGRGAIILDLAFSPDGRTLVSVGLDGSIRTWDAADGWAPRLAIAGEGGHPRCLAIAPDGRSLAIGLHDGRICVRDLASGTLTFEKGIDAIELTDVSFAPDGDRLAVASGSRVTVVDLAEPA